MNELVERVARALADAAGEPFDDVSNAKYLGDARAAIEAMREPTAAMLSALGPEGIKADHDIVRGVYKDVWTTMIDAASRSE